jgi:O-acetyl-ADP-ribose deacetylase (regulator of RNase III)
MEPTLSLNCSPCILCAEAFINGIKLEIYKGSVLSMGQYQYRSIVNAANEEMKHKGGLAGNIANLAGPDLVRQCDQYIQRHGYLRKSQAIASTAGKLNFQKVIHVAGPIIRNNMKPAPYQIEELTNCIYNCIKKACEFNIDSIAFPGISCGAFSFPKEAAAKCHLDGFLKYAASAKVTKESVGKVCFVMFTDDEIHYFVEDFLEKMEDYCFDTAKFIGKPQTQENYLIKSCGGCSNLYENTKFLIGKCHNNYCDYCIYRYNMANCLICKSSLAIEEEKINDLARSKNRYNSYAVYCRECKEPRMIDEKCCQKCKNICSSHGYTVCSYCNSPIS